MIRWLVAIVAVLLPSIAFADDAPATIPLSKLRAMMSAGGVPDATVRIEGVVCAVGDDGASLVLQDSTSTEILELPGLPAGLKKGQRFAIAMEHCTLTLGPVAIQIGTAAAVSADGLHPATGARGFSYLEKGRQPVRIEWFNRTREFALLWAIRGGGVNAATMPDALVWRKSPDGNGYVHGLDYAVYEIPWLTELPDFSKLKPVRTGTVANADLSVATRPEHVAIVFTGFVEIPESGIYEIGLTSDDGARIFLGTPRVSYPEIAGEVPVVPVPLAAAQASSADAAWVTFTGTVGFVSEERGRIHLDVTEGMTTVDVVLPKGAKIDPASLRGRSIIVEGVKRDEGITAISMRDVSIQDTSPKTVTKLTRASEIRHLRPDEAAKNLVVEISGVVTMANVRSMVIQDKTGGVFVTSSLMTLSGGPVPGQVWKIIGRTEPGAFSPIVVAQKAEFVRNGSLPKAVRPVWEQLLNGSLDAEQVEIEGVVTEVADDRMLMMTRDGEITILNSPIYPLPEPATTVEGRTKLVGSRVRMRGVYASSWQTTLGRVQPAVLSLGNVELSIDEPPPSDPFQSQPVAIADLLHFTSESTALKRVKARARMMGVRGRTYFLSDGRNGLRLAADAPLAIEVGDDVEVVGFSRVGGPSPVLLHPTVRIVGKVPPPTPQTISAEDRPDFRLDCQWVRMEATVAGDEVRDGQRTLDLRAGKHRFTVYVSAGAGVAKSFVPGSMIAVTGVYLSTPSDRSMAEEDGLEMLASTDDLILIRSGPWWTTGRLLAVVSALSGVLLLVLVWVSALHRVVARRTAELAAEIHEREVAETGRILEMERSRVAQDLHDELGAGLTEAGMLSSLLKNPGVPVDTKGRYVEQLNSLCYTMVSGLDEIVWAVNPRYDSVSDTAGYLWLFAQRLLDLAQIGCRLHTAQPMPPFRIDSRRRHGLFLAFKEALNNVVRHSGAKVVHLSLGIENDSVVLDIVDDGRGFEMSGTVIGCDGLSGMTSRMAALGGSCSIESKVGKGTSVRLTVPLNLI